MTLTSFLFACSVPPALMTAKTSPVFPILIRVETYAVEPCMSKLAIMGDALPVAKIAICSTPDKVVDTVTGTTEPFSAISGALS